jgi:aldehyde dehydrogenase (NAD+)
MHVRKGSYIDGAWRPSSGDAMFPVINPYTEEPFGEATIATADDVDAAVTAARRALGGEWRQTSLDDRVAVVKLIREGLLERAEELAAVNSSSMGVPYHGYLNLGGSIDLIDGYIEDARQVRWRYLRRDPSGDALIERRPVGVVAAIVPWNVPVRSEIKKLIPAILAGCTVVLKPAPETPFGAAALAEICSQAGLPPGVVNIVLGDGTTGDHLVRHPLIRKVAFTGSSATGSRIWAAVAGRFTRLQLELGGKSAAVVLDDTDLSDAAQWLGAGIFNLAGQQCTATSRVLAPRARYDEVVEALRAAAAGHVLGDPFDVETTMGPLVAERQRDRVLRYIELGRSEGAKVVTGGGRPAGQPQGWFVAPTVLADVDNGMRVAREEIFGPVVTIIPYESEQDAIAIANDSEYGLGGAVYSADPDRGLAVARQIDSGFISVNRFGIGPRVPFGGVKCSGTGRESGVEGYDCFLEYVSHPLSPDHAAALSKDIPPG